MSTCVPDRVDRLDEPFIYRTTKARIKYSIGSHVGTLSEQHVYSVRVAVQCCAGQGRQMPAKPVIYIRARVQQQPDATSPPVERGLDQSDVFSTLRCAYSARQFSNS